MFAVCSQLMWEPTCPIMVSRSAVHAILTFIRCIEQVTIYFLKDLMSGAKTSKYIGRPFSCDQLDIEIKAKEARHISVPYYDTLTIKTILAFLDDGHKHVYNYLPDLQELDKISRDGSVMFAIPCCRTNLQIGSNYRSRIGTRR